MELTCPVCHKNFTPNYAGRRCCSRVCADAQKPSLRERLFGNIKVSERGCWEWQGKDRNDRGYGRIKVEGVKRLVHRVSWELEVGPISEGKLILHQCDNPSCIFPEHLFEGTGVDNMQDMLRKGRANKARGAAHGRAKKTEEQVLQLLLDYKTGNFTQAQLALKYEYDPMMVSLIVRGKSWSHLQGLVIASLQ